MALTCPISCFSCWFHWACSYFKWYFYMSVIKKSHKPKQKAPLLLCSQNKVCPWCLELTCVTWAGSATATGKFSRKIQKFLGQHQVIPPLAVPVPVETLALVPLSDSTPGRSSWWQKIRFGKSRTVPGADSLLGHSVAPTGFISGSSWVLSPGSFQGICGGCSGPGWADQPRRSHPNHVWDTETELKFWNTNS